MKHSLHALLTLLFLCSSCGHPSDGGAEVWRFAIEETADSVQDRYAQAFKRRIEERLEGAVEVKVYPYGALGTSDDLTEQLRMGSLQFAMASPGHLGKSIPELQVFLLHFLFPDEDATTLAAVRDPSFRAVLRPLFQDKGMEMLSVLPEGWMVWTTQKEIRQPQDFEGVKIRTMTSPLLLAAYQAYGASPQAMPYGEVYSALQLNMIDAQVNPIFAIEEMSFFEVCDYLIQARPAPFMTTVVANRDFLENLPPATRDVVIEVIDEVDLEISQVQMDLNEERLKRMLDSKPELVVIQLSEEERQAFRRLSLPVRDLFMETAGDYGREVLRVLEESIARASTK